MRAFLAIAILLLTAILPSLSMLEPGSPLQVVSVIDVPAHSDDADSASDALSSVDSDGAYLEVSVPQPSRPRLRGLRAVPSRSAAPESNSPPHEPFPPRIPHIA